jgi:ABC-2 type transport system ATP-binding protein
MINVQNVWHHYGVRPVLRDISFRVAPGEVVVVMGPNGMGKSTLLALIGGVLSPMKGSVEIDGRRRRSSVEAELAIRKKVVYLPDDPYLPANSTGREFLLAMGRLYEVEPFRYMDHADRLLDLFDLKEQADSPIRSYSTGQKKKIGICAALITEAPIMILDEPFSGGLDSSALLALGRVLKNLGGRDDVTVIMAVPVPELVEGLADKIAIISHGRLVAYDSIDGLRRMAGSMGTLPEVLEKIIHPEVFGHIDRYFEPGAAP